MKKVHELNTEELKKVFEVNSKLQEKVFDDMFESVNFWNGEYLECWQRGAIDYCIGWDRGTYFICKDKDLFIEGLEKAQHTFCFLADEYNKTIEYVKKLINRLNEFYYDLSEKNYDRLENRIDELIEELENACYKRFIIEYESCFDSDYQLDYFLDFYASERLDENFYINADFELFEHVEYIKKYA